jgi:hypothetical protein
VLRRIFQPKRGRVAGGWKRALYKEIHNVYASSNIFKVTKLRMGWAGHIECMAEMRNVYRILVGRLRC